MKGLVAFSSLCFLSAAGETLPNLSKAIDAQKEIVAERPNDPRAYNDLGNLLALEGEVEQAEWAYRRALELAPDSLSTRFNLGLLLQQTEREPEAELEYTKLLDAAPNHGWAYYQLGVISEANGDRSRALEQYARAFALDPKLSFASTNPQIIDNRMATEALLLSSKYVNSAVATESKVPRLYDEPDRIAELMLEPLETAPGAATTDESSEEEEDGRATSASGSIGRSSTGIPGQLQDAGEEAEQPKGGGAEARRDSRAGRRAGREQQPLVRVEGAVPVVGAGRTATVGAPSSSNRRSSSVVGGGSQGDSIGASSAGDSTQAVRAQPPRGAKYRPALGSTGRLELRLEGPAPVLESSPIEVAEGASPARRAGA